MRLNSVYELKQKLRESYTIPKAFAQALNIDLHTHTNPIISQLASAQIGAPQEIKYSLGIAQGKTKNDFRLGVRLHIDGAEADAITERIIKETNGECDIKTVLDISTATDRFQNKQRPIQSGYSVGLYNTQETGTIGCIVEDRGTHYILSNNHVLANSNEAEPGDLVVQPGSLDMLPNQDTVVAVLDRFIKISFKRSNIVDCAIATLLDGVEFDAAWNESIFNNIVSNRRASVDDIGSPVKKVGRTTGITEGTITQVEVDSIKVNFGTSANPNVASFSDQIEIEGKGGKKFSESGDSGSLVVSEEGIAFALLFANSKQTGLSYANQIENVLQKLGVSFSLKK